MIAPFRVTIIYRAECEVCDATAEQVYRSVALYSAAPVASIPTGWRVVDGRPYCPSHRITITPTPASVKTDAEMSWSER